MVPWPPPGGLPPGEDPFSEAPDAPREPSFLLPEDLEKRERFRLTKERAITASVILHLLLALALVVMPPSEKKEVPLDQLPDPLGLVQLLRPPPREPPIPVQFFPAPGPKSPTPGSDPLPSDQNRRAHGGDPALPKMTQPRAVARSGIRDLEEGKRGEPAPPQPAGAPRGAAQAAESEGSPDALAAAEPPQPKGTAPRPGTPRLQGLPQSTVAGLTAEQAARAAREAGGGEEGAGFEQEGGFADSGPLSFDTVEYDWGPYAAAMIRRIKLHWEIPALARYGIKGRVTIRFFIERDGRVTGLTILRPSGHPPFDNAAYQAVATSSPFRPLPADLGHEREGVTVTFFYNLRPEDEAAPRRPLIPKGTG